MRDSRRSERDRLVWFSSQSGVKILRYTPSTLSCCRSWRVAFMQAARTSTDAVVERVPNFVDVIPFQRLSHPQHRTVRSRPFFKCHRVAYAPFQLRHQAADWCCSRRVKKRSRRFCYLFKRVFTDKPAIILNSQFYKHDCRAIHRAICIWKEALYIR